MSKKPPDILEKPVHIAVLKPSYIQELEKQGKLKSGGVILKTPVEAKLPVQKPAPKKKSFNPLAGIDTKSGANLSKQAGIRTKLRILYDRVPPPSEDAVPPCDSCKASPCCKAFLVSLTPAEYESGVYGDYAIEITQEQVKQLQGRLLLPTTATMPIHDSNAKDQYYLEGRIGEACPFLQEDQSCGIYDDRPLVCRVYTCVGDDRITQKMRDGLEEPISNRPAALAASRLRKDRK